MKKIKKNAGFTLMELICTLLILVLLVMGIGVGMDTGSRIYRDATFEADSATLSGILNTTVGDVLRYCMVTKTEGLRNLPDGMTTADLPYVYTNLEYGVRRAYFNYAELGGTSILSMVNLKTGNADAITTYLVNTGAYPELKIENFVVHYEPRKDAGVEGGYFSVSYEIVSKTDPTKTREVEMIVRHMND